MADNDKIDIFGQMKDPNKSPSSPETSDSIPISAPEEVAGEEDETLESIMNANNDAKQEKTDTKVAGDSEPHKARHEDIKEVEQMEPTKRTRVRKNSKSIIQNAIARKEKSFNTYERPKRRGNQKRKAWITIDKKSEKPESTPKKTILPRKTKTSPRTSIKSIYVEFESSEDSLENENTVRLSSRAFSGNKSSASVSTSEEIIIEAKILSRLCKCSENKQLYMENDSGTHFCTAVDSLRDKLVGCSRLVEIKNVPMCRPSTRVPFGVYCESHKQRLIRHNCCPTCGVFCTEGNFSQCALKHHFHKDCKLSIENRDYCPHCGDSAPSSTVLISMHTSKKPLFLPVQRSQQ